MTEQSQNTVFQNSSFLQGQNVHYVEALHALHGAPAGQFRGLVLALDDGAILALLGGLSGKPRPAGEWGALLWLVAVGWLFFRRFAA